ncbi:unnamed protein product [Heligmosomoides polygyrus]|uniref:DBD_Tnp_Mut domain-containing protein n=1 Tax=Heligmosomoides polygyrus TaxID=6339 RepID=A0A183G8W0_HELPZ|nr:unnamed protein product [Heligmosomoides polygyrus]
MPVEVQKPDRNENGAVEPKAAGKGQRPEVHSGTEAEEDLPDLYKEGDDQQSLDFGEDEIDHAGKHREEIRKRMAEQQIEMENLQYLPKRKFTQEATMRPAEQFLRYEFCFAKGEHYTDTCSEATSVKRSEGTG